MPPLFRRTAVAVATAASAFALTLAVTQPATAAPAAPATLSLTGSFNDPGGDAFYTPPTPLPAGRPGDVIRYRQINFTQWLIMYLTTNALGRPAAVTGTVLVPFGKNPATLPVVAYAPGTQGPAFKCAPSKGIQSGLFTEGTAVTDITNAGYAAVVPDYDGYYNGGTPSYITGRNEGPEVLDAIRAATRLAPAGLKASNPVVIQGYSQGGGAALWAGELQPTYAPEIPLKGISAGGVPADLTAVAAGLDGNIGFGFLGIAAIGLDAAYPDLKLDSYLNSNGRTKLAQIKTACVTDLFGYAYQKISDYTTTNPLTTPTWKARLAQNKLGFTPPKVPLFQYLGSLDEIVAVPQGQALYRTYCAAGVKTSFKAYEVAEHITGGFIAAKAEVQKFTADRIAGRPATSTC